MKEAIEKHWSRDAGSYNKSVQTALRSEETKGPWKDIFSRVLGTSQLNILDVGTGPGSVALLLARWDIVSQEWIFLRRCSRMQ